jgi:hypothetical protein
MTKAWVRRGRIGSAALAVIMLAPAMATAQTWAAGTTPRLRELIAVDRTGEVGWPFGSEDLAGDGLTFAQEEQSVDLRTVYAATDAERFWIRAYVSSEERPAESVSLYVFIDADRNAVSGGDAVASDIDPRLSNDPSAGGYEYLFAMDGKARALGLFAWKNDQWTNVNAKSAQLGAEIDTDRDPILWGADEHGYLQGSIDLSLVGLTVACDANLFVRSVDAQTSVSDLDIGQVGACVPADANDDGVPDVIVNLVCTREDDCPAGGLCIFGRCMYAAECATKTDCAADQVCTDGRCVAAPGGTCSKNADCDALVCRSGKCVACTANSQCGSGKKCAPDGTCVNGTSGDDGSADTGGSGGSKGTEASAADLAAGEEIQGGACACSLVQAGRTEPGVLLALAVCSWLFARRRRHP